MKKKKRALFMLLCTLLLCMFGTVSVQAATVKKVSVYAKKKVTFKEDVTGDGKADTIVITPVKGNYGMPIGTIKVSVNGKRVLKLKTTGYGFTTNYIQLSKNKKFLQIYTEGDGGSIPTNCIYQFDKKGTKLTQVLDLKIGVAEAKGVISASGNTIKVPFSKQPAAVGWVSWNYSYKYTGGKFKLTSSIASVKSTMSDIGDGYTALFRKNKFKARKTILFYKKTNLSELSFTAEKGDILKMKRIKVSDKSVYIQFQKGNKTGWQKVDRGYDWFYGVSDRLIG